MTNNKDEKLCPYCNGQGKMWCAACGKYGDHGSATCPTITHKQEVREEEKHEFNMPKVQADWKWRHDNRVKDIEHLQSKIKALEDKLQQEQEMSQFKTIELGKLLIFPHPKELQSQLSALTQENKELKEALEFMANGYMFKVFTKKGERLFQIIRIVEYSRDLDFEAKTTPLEAIQSAQSMERNKEGNV